MNLFQLIQDQIIVAVKAGDDLKRNILKLLKSELQTLEGRGVVVTDDLVIKSAKRLIQSNEETIKLGGDSEKLSKENTILGKFIPRTMDIAELTVEIDRLELSGNIGQMTGSAIKQLKVKGFVFESKDVSEVLKIKAKT